LGRACVFVGDRDDARRYFKQAKEGYEEQLGLDIEKALEATLGLIMSTDMVMEKLRDLLKRCEKALGEENDVTLETLNELGGGLKDNGEYEEARKVLERCLAGRMKVLGKDHKNTFGTLNNLGNIYSRLRNYQKALEYFERALEGKEKLLGKSHPDTLSTVLNIAIIYLTTKDFGKAEELYERALEGFEAHLGKDHERTIKCVKIFSYCLQHGGTFERLASLTNTYPWLNDAL